MAATARMDLRLELANKQLIEEAARLLSTSVSNFTTSAALEKARDVLLEHQAIKVSQEAYEHLLFELQQPSRVIPELLEQLKKDRQAGR